MTFDRWRSAPIATARARRSSLHAVTQRERLKCARAPPCARVALGDEHVRSVKADDERYRTGCGGPDDAARYHPMRVHDRGAFLLRHAERLEPSGHDGQRCHRDRRRAQTHVGSHALGVAECIERGDRRVVKEMEVHAAIDLRPVPLRMPRRHEMYLVAARRNAAGDRLHEAADRVALEPRIRRRHHDDAVAHTAEMSTYHNLNAVSDRSSRR